MADRPILYSTPMVQAVDANRKSQTRRIMRIQPPKNENFIGSYFGVSRCVADNIKLYSLNDYDRLPKHPTDWELVGSVGVARGAGFPARYRVPYAIGDRLYVREAFSYETLDVDRNGFMPPWYWADGNPTSGDFTKPKPSIHMPRWASRLTLVVTDVRVGRLNEISEADAKAEGITEILEADKDDRRHFGLSGTNAIDGPTARHAFAGLWTLINGADAWEANPWVVAVSFETHHCNIDAMPTSCVTAAKELAHV